MNIILDYNRTLYDPETQSLYPEAAVLLRNLSQKHDLYLIGRNEPGRSNKLDELDIRRYFKEVRFVDQKTEELFGNIITDNENVTFVIGDRVYEEIAIGNKLGYRTIWVRQGKFSGETPRKEAENPLLTVHSLSEIEPILEKHA